jgi:hypothetical protein
MCDYSLHHVASRPAKAGDKLVSSGFPNSVSRGFAAAADPMVAVCLRPGTELAFDDDVRVEPSFPLWPRRRIRARVARFRQLDPGNPATHHDALEFPDGRIVLLTRLVRGQRATVLQLPVVLPPQPAAPREGRRLVSRRWWSDTEPQD